MLTMSLPILTIWQPWATLIMEGFKLYEFRGWPAPHEVIGSRMGIHAGKRRPDAKAQGDLRTLIYKLEHGGDMARATGLVRWDECLKLLERWIIAPRAMVDSSILGSVVVGKPVQNAELAAVLGVAWVNDSDKDEHSSWGWPVSDPQYFQPVVPSKGERSIWHWRPNRQP